MTQQDYPKQLRVLLAATQAGARDMAACLKQMGHGVTGRSDYGPALCRLAGQLNPDLVLLDTDLPPAGLEGLADWPVVLVVRETDAVLERLARLPEASGLVIPPLEPGNLGPAITLALANHARCQGLVHRVQDLERALAERKLVERAKGLVMQRLGLGEAEARAHLEQQARRHGLSLPQLASGLVESQEMMAG